MFAGLNFYAPWQASLQARLREVRIGQGGVTSLPQLTDPTSGFSNVNGADGEAFYLGKLSRGELSRPGLLRELSWSEEGRARWGRLL